MICLKNSILVRAELLQFGLEELRLLVCESLLVQDESIRDVVGVNLNSQLER